MNEGEDYETKKAEQRARATIATIIPALQLVELCADDAEAYYHLIDRNRTHLTQHGD
jgi:hypothetical protein